jgi:hypothetical protein
MMKDIGYWDALAWGSLFAILIILAYLLLGRRKQRETEEFLCGEEFEYTTPAHNFFYGFEKTLEPIFKTWRRFHAEIINEYVAWVLMFALLVSMLLILMFVMRVRII